VEGEAGGRRREGAEDRGGGKQGGEEGKGRRERGRGGESRKMITRRDYQEEDKGKQKRPKLIFSRVRLAAQVLELQFSSFVHPRLRLRPIGRYPYVFFLAGEVFCYGRYP
jgi:hypothetical protein